MKLRPIIAILIATSTSMQAGCSFLFVEAPPALGEIPFRRMDDSFCTESNRAPVTDSILVGAIPLFTLLTAAAPGKSNELSDAEAVVVVTSVLLATGVEAISAIWGFHTTRKCRRYAARHLRADL